MFRHTMAGSNDITQSKTAMRTFAATGAQPGTEDAAGQLAGPQPVSVEIASYRDSIAQSRGEFTVAKDIYVRPNTGWFSDRSAC